MTSPRRALIARLGRDRGLAKEWGLRCRSHALDRFGLARFPTEWDLLQEVTR